ncbi:Ldh family oxidoreductase [Bacillus sp. MHSD_36]|uniref:Ldh family oxidoreductase n=1 Tax=unclassified Bacillus (in: firmicutes) TaxID=185979 RepID=UPI0027423F2E|nr:MULTISPECIES: Ldh family oxidoreductase [unclassified Bacillus (in: firmicutes)]MDD1367852.1 Ldh family oxidoreductase [Bacillus sp. MHSD17]MDP7992292.1 Ldh family oxidoreductase [Bacillus sp. MHSD_36]MDR4980851.1 Ldh family oxidoreductase [Bacillus sp. MHSD_37]
MNTSYLTVDAIELRKYVENLYQNYGFKQEDCETVADVLLAADLRGVDSHGVSRLAWYDEWIEKGLINLKPNIKITTETPTTANVDGDNGMGMLVSKFAMNLAIKKAKEYGTGLVSVGRSNHYGIAGYYSMMASKEDMVGISMTNMIPIVAPTNGKQRMLGTNPISFAIPAKTEDPFVLDMATTAVSGGKLEIAMREERDIPYGLAIDKEGRATNNPKDPWDNGALVPLGGDSCDTGGHKGYGLATLVNALSGALSGSIYGINQSDSKLFGNPLSVVANVGHFFGAFKVEGFREKEEVLTTMDGMLRSLKESEPAPGHERVYVAGEKEFESERKRVKNGIPLHIKTIKELAMLGEKYNINYDFLPLNNVEV